MKKFFLILLSFIFIAALFLFNFIRTLGTSDPASLVPADTSIFATLPDLFRTATRWPHTSLAKIIAEPDVKEFLKKPLLLLDSSENGNEAREKILDIKPRRIFFALPKISPEKTHILLGFQFLGTHKKVLNSWEAIREKFIGEPEITSSRTTTQYNGDTIETTVYENRAFHSAVHGRWGFLSNDLPTVQDALDRAARRKKSDPSLAQSPDYLKINHHLPTHPDLQIFINLRSTLEALLTLGSNMGNIPDPSQIEPLKNLTSLGISSKLEKDRMRDTFAIIVSEPTQFLPLQHIAMPYTHSDTLGYLETSTEWHGMLSSAVLFSENFLKNFPLFSEEFHQIFGPELALFFSWPAGNLRPPIIVATGIKNLPDAKKYLQQTAFTLRSDSPLPDTTLYQLELPSYPLLTPTVALKDNLLLGAVTALDIEQALSQATPSTTLENSAAFTPALGHYRAQNILFSFLNTRELFERTYSLFRPVIIFSAALLPDFLVDPSKLPAASSISKHLQPIIATQQLQGDVCVYDSTGPITLDQALLAFFFAKTKLFPVQP